MESLVVHVSFRLPSSGYNLMIRAYSPWGRCSHFTVLAKGQLPLGFGQVLSLLVFTFCGERRKITAEPHPGEVNVSCIKAVSHARKI